MAKNDTAPWFTIPEVGITSIEHPCIVKNRLKAIEMLGGPQQIAQNLEHGTQQSLSLTFSPQDPASRTIMSLHNETNNILLKVTVPKRTGRKRKRGSHGDYIQDSMNSSMCQDASVLLDSLKRNPEQYDIEPVGNIKSCHVWRGIPDFVYFTKPSSFLRGIETQLLSQQYPLLKQWSLPRTYGLEDTEIIPPPVFSTQTLPHNYLYRQNPAVKTLSDPATGSRTLHNTAQPLRLHMQIRLFDDPVYPTARSAECPPLEEQTKQIQDLVQELQNLFDKRPIWTRRALVNSLSPESPAGLVRVAAAYVCYSLRSGPWRDAYCKLGIDPRNDPQCRKYQTILLRLMPKGSTATRAGESAVRLWSRSPDTESHIFTGTKTVPPDGKTWQLCDLHDPALKSLVEVPEVYIRAKCETRYFGWYENGTSAKMRVLLKAKIDALAEGNNVDPVMVQNFLQLPESWNYKPNTTFLQHQMTGHLPDSSSRVKELEWASAYRSICRTAGGTIPSYGANGKGRISKRKPLSRPSYLGPTADSPIEEYQDVDGIEQEVEDVEDTQNAEDAQVAEEYEEPEEDEGDLAEDT